MESFKPDTSASDLGEGLFDGIPMRHPVLRPPAAVRRVSLLDQPEARQEAEPRSPLGPARSLGHFLEDPGADELAACALPCVHAARRTGSQSGCSWANRITARRASLAVMR